MAFSSRNDIEFRSVTKRYGDVTAVADVDLNVPKGAFLALLGPSGCGKTTCLRMIGGFEQPTGGSVLIDGHEMNGVPAYRRPVNMVFQHYALFPHFNVEQNVAYGLRQMRPRLTGSEISRRVAEALEMVRLSGFASRRIHEMSGGQQQRVALARAIVNRPSVLLLDEPLAALDKKLREEMRSELREIQRSVGITTIFVTHDQSEALGLSDRIAVMYGGRIEQLGAPREIYERPATRFVAEFIGASSVLRGRATAGDRVTLAGGEPVRVLGLSGLSAGAAVELAIRPERIRLAGGDGENVMDGRVTGVVYQGVQTDLTVEIGGGQRLLVFVAEPAPTAFAPGQAVRLHLPPDAFMRLQGAGREAGR